LCLPLLLLSANRNIPPSSPLRCLRLSLQAAKVPIFLPFPFVKITHFFDPPLPRFLLPSKRYHCVLVADAAPWTFSHSTSFPLSSFLRDEMTATESFSFYGPSLPRIGFSPSVYALVCPFRFEVSLSFSLNSMLLSYSRNLCPRPPSFFSFRGYFAERPP